MANTTNLDLVKPAGTDHALISVLNSNSDKIDAFAGQTNDSLSAEQNGLAYIVGNTNTTGGTLAVGQFVYVKGHSTIPEGLRKVTSSISANGSITTSNTDACSEGGLNALNGKIATVEVLTDTFPNSVGATQLAYPTGFDAINTYVLSLMVRHDSVWYSRMEADSAAVYLTGAGIFAYNNTPGWVNDTFRIMIAKK